MLLVVDPHGRHSGETVVVKRDGQRLLEILKILGGARGGAEEVSGIGVRGHPAPVHPERELELAGGHHHLLRAEFQTPRLYHGGAIDPVIREHHHEQRQVKANCRREYQVAEILRERTLVFGYLLGAYRPPPRYRGEGDRARADPHDGDQDRRAFPAHTHRIREGIGDRPVTVQANHAQIQDRCRGEENVQRAPDVAPVRREEPTVLQYLVYRADRHHHQAYQAIGASQRCHEIVRRCVQMPLAKYGEDNQRVAEDGSYGEEQQNDRETDSIRGESPEILVGLIKERWIARVVETLADQIVV